MKWWNHLYLTEGLATYAQYLGMEASSTDLMGEEYAILDSFQYSLLYDSSAFTHPLSWNVSTPDEIDGMFSTISYEKGASIFRMVEGFLTKETFRKGLQIYLKRFAFQGAEQEDLFNCLEEAALEDKMLPDGLSMSKIMHSWVDQSGFPVVKVGISGENMISLQQEKFRRKTSPESEGLWYIPVTVMRKGNKRENNVPEIWLETDGKEKVIQHDTSQWIMINNNSTGFYRVLYNDTLLHLIQKQLEDDHNEISALSRSQLLDDYFVFAKQEYIRTPTALNLTRYLHKERHFAPWSTFLEHFSPIYKRFSSHPAYPLIQKYLRPKVDKALLAVGLEESPKHKGALAILRADLLDWSCSLESPLCKEYAGKLFAQWQASDSKTNPITSVDAKATLECAMVLKNGRKAYDFLFARYAEVSNDTDSREEIISSLACTMDPLIIHDLLSRTLNSSLGLYAIDAITVFEKVASNPTGREVILQFMSENIDHIVDVIGGGSARPVATVLYQLAKHYSTTEQMKQVKAFIETHKEKLITIKSTTKAAITIINENIQWMDTKGLDIWRWLWHNK